jgi:hypothetical protein
VRCALERASVDAPHRGSHQFRHGWPCDCCETAHCCPRSVRSCVTAARNRPPSTPKDVQFGSGAHVHVIGKGRKERCTPLSKDTRAVLAA